MAHHQECHRAEIGISVRGAYRGKGIGTRLLKRSEEWARSNSISQIELTAHASNPAIALYKRFGFKIMGRIPNGFCIEGDYHDIVSMFYKLP